MRIILEGMDGAGKSTQAKKLAKEFGLSYIHLTDKDPRDYHFYKQILQKDNVVFDRSFLSNEIYDKVFKREPTLSENGINKLKELIKELDYQVFVLASPIAETKKFLAVKGEHPAIINKLRNIKSDYAALCWKNSYTYLEFDNEFTYEYLKRKIKWQEIEWKTITI